MKLNLELIFLSSALNVANSQKVYEGPRVNTLTGDVSGLNEETSAGNPFYKFLGVPYAEPPIQNLRFKDPVPKQAWAGTLNATEFPDICLQQTYIPGTPVSLLGSEDCLYLNIYTPSLPTPGYLVPTNLKPVMFWIHGGGFTTGDSNDMTNPELFLDEDVLVVTVHYRLGPFGFLALEDNPELAGNIGLKDQQEALQWVNKNIIYFGGDPAKVTLFGESAGAISVHAHVLSPRIKNIFQGAILQSGTILMMYEPIFIEKKAQQNSERFLAKIGCNVTDVLECLQMKDVETLMEFSANDAMEQSNEESTFYWVVQDYSSPSPVLPYTPLQQLTVENVKKVPLIVGITKDDGGLILFSDNGIKEGFEENNKTKLMTDLGLGTEDITEEQKLIVDVMRKFYLSEGSYDVNENNIIEMATDSWFTSGMAETSKLHQQVAPVFPYILNDRCSNISVSSFFGGGDKDYGVSHGDDLNCLFKPIPLFGSITDAGKLTSKAMIRSWTNFAKYQNPSPYHSSEPVWPNGEVMFFEPESGLKKNETQLENVLARMLLWGKLYWKPLKEKLKFDGQQSIFTYPLSYNWFNIFF